MKHFLFILLIINVLIVSTCNGQKEDEFSSIDFFDLIKNYNEINILTKTINHDDKVTLIYYEFTMKEPKIGLGSLFAISKKIPEQWTNDAIVNPKGKCKTEKQYSELFYKECAARQLFYENRQILIDSFNVYAFFINKNNLIGPFEEATESGSVQYYLPKPDGYIQIYKYIDNQWERLGDEKLKEQIPRTFGELYITNLVRRIINK